MIKKMLNLAYFCFLITLISGCNKDQISGLTLPPTPSPTPSNIKTSTPTPKPTPSKTIISKETIKPTPSKKPTPIKTSTPIKNRLTLDRSYLGKENKDGSISNIDTGEFKRGENIYFVLVNVGKFEKNQDGENWIDIDLIVKNNKNKVVVSRQNMLGEKGKTVLENDTALSPYGKININPKTVKSGKYTITITIYDKVSGAKLSQTKNLILK